MITPTEKRLQELENKAAIFLAQSMDQKGKIEDVEELKKQIEGLKESLKHFFKGSMENFQNLEKMHSKNELNIQTLAPHITKFSIDIEDLKKVDENLNMSVASACKSISELKSEIKAAKEALLKDESYKEEINKIICSYLVNQNTIKNEILILKNELKTEISVSSESLKDSQGDLKKIVENHSEKIKDFLEAFPAMKCYIDKEVNKVDKKILPQSDDRASVFESMISETKSEMISIKSSIESLTSRLIDQDKINTKLKILENSIAQLYEFIKKQELKVS